MEVAARELIPALLAQAPPGMRFTAFINREAAAAGDGPWGELLPAVTVPVNARNRVQWVLGEQALLPRMAARAGVDLVHSLASTAPLWGRFRRVVTVHDLIYARFPEAHAGIRDKGMRVLVPWAARRSDRVIVDSQSTRDDLMRLHRRAGPTASTSCRSASARCGARRPLSEREVRARFDLGERRSRAEPVSQAPAQEPARADRRAGAARTPRAVRCSCSPAIRPRMRTSCATRARALDVDGDVRFPAWVSAAELEGLWAIAQAFVFPSLYEGFGLPVLEAMARGVPVACSNASSLPEVAGDAALLFDPHDEHAIAEALRRLLEDPALRERLHARGLARAREFSWERAARLTLESYARALGSA